MNSTLARIALLILFGVVKMGWGESHGCAQNLTRMFTVGTTTVKAWTPVSFQFSGSNSDFLLMPTSTAAAAGVVNQGTDCAPGTSCAVLTYGQTPCQFDGPAISGDDVVIVPGFCHDGGVTQTFNVPYKTGQPGKIGQLRTDLGTNVYDINFIAGGRHGSMPDALATVATTGLYSDLIGKPTIPAGTVTGVTATSPVTSTGGAAPVIACPTCLTAQNTVWYSNGTLVSTPVKCNWMTATTAGTGLAVFNYSGMGFTSLVGDPQPAIRGTGTTPYLINIQGTPTTTSTTVYASQASIISVVGINVTLIGLAASAPVSLQVCGT